MRRLHAHLFPRRLRTDELGATAVEYALMVSAIAGVIVVIVFTLGTQVADLFQRATPWP